MPYRDGDELTSGYKRARDNAAPRVPIVVVMLFLGWMALLGWVAWSLTMAPIAATDSPPTPVPASSSPASAATYPAEIIAAANAISTYYAPTPEPTAKPMRPTSTPAPKPLFCPDDPNVLLNGTICRGMPPLPTPTVMPACLSPAIPGTDCVVRHSRIGTPVAGR